MGERTGRARLAPDPTPRIGADGADTNASIWTHAFDIGAFNPCFPEYKFDHIDAETASGRVTFPVVYEGPPGLVHGGFLAVFFDCVIQHQNCAPRLSGKTRSLNVTFRRPTPILTELRFDIAPRAGRDGKVTSTARLLLDDEVLCIGEATTLAPRRRTSSPGSTSASGGPDPWSCSGIRQPRVAEIVASRLRDEILSGRLKEGDVLPSQESLFPEFGVSPPALREAIHILETDGLISVRRGNVGGAVVHLPSAERTAHMISMVLQTRGSTPADVSGALMHLEPICAGMCAARDDRLTEVVPYLQAEIELQTEQFDDLSRYVPNARRFHEALVSRCGNEPMILLIGSLELIWSAHESSVWSDERRWTTRPCGPRCATTSGCWTPSATATRRARCGWRRTTSPRRGATPSPSVRTKPLRPN